MNGIGLVCAREMVERCGTSPLVVRGEISPDNKKIGQVELAISELEALISETSALMTSLGTRLDSVMDKSPEPCDGKEDMVKSAPVAPLADKITCLSVKLRGANAGLGYILRKIEL